MNNLARTLARRLVNGDGDNTFAVVRAALSQHEIMEGAHRLLAMINVNEAVVNSFVADTPIDDKFIAMIIVKGCSRLIHRYLSRPTEEMRERVMRIVEGMKEQPRCFSGLPLGTAILHDIGYDIPDWLMERVLDVEIVFPTLDDDDVVPKVVEDEDTPSTNTQAVKILRSQRYVVSKVIIPTERIDAWMRDGVIPNLRRLRKEMTMEDMKRALMYPWAMMMPGSPTVAADVVIIAADE